MVVSSSPAVARWQQWGQEPHDDPPNGDDVQARHARPRHRQHDRYRDGCACPALGRHARLPRSRHRRRAARRQHSGNLQRSLQRPAPARRRRGDAHAEAAWPWLRPAGRRRSQPAGGRPVRARGRDRRCRRQRPHAGDLRPRGGRGDAADGRRYAASAAGAAGTGVQRTRPDAGAERARGQAWQGLSGTPTRPARPRHKAEEAAPDDEGTVAAAATPTSLDVPGRDPRCQRRQARSTGARAPCARRPRAQPGLPSSHRSRSPTPVLPAPVIPAVAPADPSGPGNGHGHAYGHDKA